MDRANARDTMSVCGRRSCSRCRCMRIRCSVPKRMVSRIRNNNNISMSVTNLLSVGIGCSRRCSNSKVNRTRVRCINGRTHTHRSGIITCATTLSSMS